MESPGGKLEELRGQTYFDQGDDAKALKMFKKALARDPADPETHYGLGVLYEGQAQYAEALQAFTRVVDLVPTSSVGYEKRGDVYAALEQYAEAKKDLDRALKLDPNDVFAHVSRALVSEAEEDYIAALKDYDEVIRLEPDQADGYTRRGSLLISLSGYDWALRSFNQAINLDHNDSEAWTYKADALRLWAYDLKQPRKLSKALATADEALRRNRKNPLIHAVKGAILSALDCHSEAIEAFNKAIKFDSADFWALKEKGKALYRSGRYKHAFEGFCRLEKRSADFRYQAVAGQSLALRKLSQGAQAGQVLDRFSQDVSADGNDYLELARAYVEFEEWEDATSYFLRTIQTNPSHADAHNELAWYQAVKLNKDLEVCTAHAELALALLPKNRSKAIYLDTLGWIWFLRGNLRKAHKYLQEAVRLLEPDMLIRHHLKKVDMEIAKSKRTDARG